MHMKFCQACGHFLPFTEEICPDCANSSTNPNPQEDFYLSGASQPSVKKQIFTQGEIINERFRILENLGSSNSVYCAEDLLLGIKVAIKIIFEGPADQLSDRFQACPELNRFLQIPQCQHIIRTYDFRKVHNKDKWFIVQSMEYGNTGTFRNFLTMLKNDRVARMTTGLKYFIQACRGIEVIHNNNIIHLDVRPENLLFIDGNIKVSDIGIFQYSFISQKENGNIVKKIIHKISSPVYMSPELFYANYIHEIDCRSDIYSLGILLYEIFHPSCLPPFCGSFKNLREAHLRSALPCLWDIDSNVAEIIACCLKKNPDERLGTTSDLLTALDDIVSKPMTKKPQAEEATNIAERSDEDNQAIIAFEKAKKLYDQNKLNETNNILRTISPDSSCQREANTLQRKIKERYSLAEKLYSQINSQFSEGKLSDLVDVIKEVCEIYPEHPDGISVQTKLLSMARNYNETLTVGRGYLEQEKWEDALCFYNHAPSIEKCDPIIQRTVEVIEKITDLRTEIDIALKNEEFEKVMSLACIVDQQKRWFYEN